MTILLWTRVLVLGALAAATAFALWATLTGRE
jgi:hypothetical protein